MPAHRPHQFGSGAVIGLVNIPGSTRHTARKRKLSGWQAICACPQQNCFPPRVKVPTRQSSCDVAWRRSTSIRARLAEASLARCAIFSAVVRCVAVVAVVREICRATPLRQRGKVIAPTPGRWERWMRCRGHRGGSGKALMAVRQLQHDCFARRKPAKHHPLALFVVGASGYCRDGACGPVR